MTRIKQTTKTKGKTNDQALFEEYFALICLLSHKCSIHGNQVKNPLLVKTLKDQAKEIMKVRETRKQKIVRTRTGTVFTKRRKLSEDIKDELSNLDTNGYGHSQSSNIPMPRFYPTGIQTKKQLTIDVEKANYKQTLVPVKEYPESLSGSPRQVSSMQSLSLKGLAAHSTSIVNVNGKPDKVKSVVRTKIQSRVRPRQKKESTTTNDRMSSSTESSGSVMETFEGIEAISTSPVKQTNVQDYSDSDGTTLRSYRRVSGRSSELKRSFDRIAWSRDMDDDDDDDDFQDCTLAVETIDVSGTPSTVDTLLQVQRNSLPKTISIAPELNVVYDRGSKPSLPTHHEVENEREADEFFDAQDMREGDAKAEARGHVTDVVMETLDEMLPMEEKSKFMLNPTNQKSVHRLIEFFEKKREESFVSKSQSQVDVQASSSLSEQLDSQLREQLARLITENNAIKAENLQLREMHLMAEEDAISKQWNRPELSLALIADATEMQVAVMRVDVEAQYRDALLDKTDQVAELQAALLEKDNEINKLMKRVEDVSGAYAAKMRSFNRRKHKVSPDLPRNSLDDNFQKQHPRRRNPADERSSDSSSVNSDENDIIFGLREMSIVKDMELKKMRAQMLEKDREICQLYMQLSSQKLLIEDMTKNFMESLENRLESPEYSQQLAVKSEDTGDNGTSFDVNAFLFKNVLEKQQACDKLTSALNVLEREVQALENRVEEQDEENFLLKEKEQKLERDLRIAKAQVSRTQAENERITTSLHEKQERIQNLIGFLQDKEKQILHLDEQVDIRQHHLEQILHNVQTGAPLPDLHTPGINPATSTSFPASKWSMAAAAVAAMESSQTKAEEPVPEPLYDVDHHQESAGSRLRRFSLMQWFNRGISASVDPVEPIDHDLDTHDLYPRESLDQDFFHGDKMNFPPTFDEELDSSQHDIESVDDSDIYNSEGGIYENVDDEELMSNLFNSDASLQASYASSNVSEFEGFY